MRHHSRRHWRWSCSHGAGQDEAFVEHWVIELCQYRQRERSHHSWLDKHCKACVLTAIWWVKFCEQIPEIDTAIRRAITLKPTDYRVHVGSNWHITVTDDMPFVDIMQTVHAKWWKRFATVSRWHLADIRTEDQSEDGHRRSQRRVRWRRVVLAP